MIEPTVHLVDDDTAFLMALSRLLRLGGYATKTYSSAPEFLARRCFDEPGCAIVDLKMPQVDGLDLQSALAQSPYPIPVVFLTGHADTASVVRAMRSGAEDFLEKTASKELLLDAVRRALLRDRRDREARLRLDQLRRRFAAITVRQRDVLVQVLRGKLTKQIASDLGIHERTVKVHRSAIMTKLQVRSVAELARLAQEAGLQASPATWASNASASLSPSPKQL